MDVRNNLSVSQADGMSKSVLTEGGASPVTQPQKEFVSSAASMAARAYAAPQIHFGMNYRTC